MISTILGRVTQSLDVPRGPDVQMDVAVPEDWLKAGATVEIELPRNLACASCGGGGCDRCGRSGAVSTRGRKDPVELVEVTLPKAGGEGQEAQRGVMVRIPERGGPAPDGTDLRRGHLILSIRPGESHPGVKRLPRPSLRPPTAEIMPQRPSPVPASLRPRPNETREIQIVLALAVLLVAFLVAWFGH